MSEAAPGGGGLGTTVSRLRALAIDWALLTMVWLMAEFLLKQGSTLPRHGHPHEQTGYLVKGRIRLSIGTEAYDVQPGDSWCIPSGVEHGAEIIEDSVGIEVFSPVREDYLPDERETP